MIKLKYPFAKGESYPITQSFGANPDIYRRFGLPAHNGLDFGCPEGTKLAACAKGVILMSKKHKAYGNIVKIKHAGGYYTLYAHLSERFVMPGEEVKEGDIIGLSGSTGFSTGPHLHFGLQSIKHGTKPYNYYMDPMEAIEGSSKKKDSKKKSTVRTSTSNRKSTVTYLSKSSKKTTSTKKNTEIHESNKKYIFKNNINFQDKNKEVIELQKRLKEEGFFHYPRFTEYYGSVTRKAVLDYQLARGIVHSPYDTGAGRLGPGTRASLNR